MKSIRHSLLACLLLVASPAGQAGLWDDISDEAEKQTSELKDKLMEKSKDKASELADDSKSSADDWAESAGDKAKSWWKDISD